LATPQCRFLSQAAARGGRTLVRGRTNRNRCWRDKATIAASFSSVRTVDRTSFGPIGASLAKLRFFHLATAFGLIPYCSASSCRLFLTMLQCSTYCRCRCGRIHVKLVPSTLPL